MQKIQLLQNVTLKSHEEWDLKEPLKKHSLTAYVQRLTTSM